MVIQIETLHTLSVLIFACSYVCELIKSYFASTYFCEFENLKISSLSVVKKKKTKKKYVEVKYDFCGYLLCIYFRESRLKENCSCI